MHVGIYVYVRNFVNLTKTPLREIEFSVRYNITLQEGKHEMAEYMCLMKTVDTHFEIASSVLLINLPSL